MNILKLLLSIPKTVYFNLRYLSLRDAVKLPIWLTYNTKARAYRGG